MPLTLVRQVVGGAALGLVFLWVFVLVGTWLNDRRDERELSAFQARLEINEIRRRTIHQLFDIANGRDGFVRPTRRHGHRLDHGEEEP